MESIRFFRTLGWRPRTSPRERAGGFPPRVLWLAAAITTVTTLLPVVYLLVRVGGVGNDFWRTLFRAKTLHVFLNSLGLAAAVTFSATAIGVALAWLLVRSDLPARRFWSVVTTLPLVMPSYVGAYALVAALGPRGMLQEWLEPFGIERLPSIYGFPGAWLALTLFTYPYVMLTTRAGLRGLDPVLEDAARNLGAGAHRVFWQITFPHLRPAIQAGALLVALYTLSDFGAVALLQFDSFTRAIYVQYIGSFDRSAAAVLALLLVGLTCLILMLEYRIRGRAHYYRTSTGTARRVQLATLGPWRYPALFFCGAVTTVALVVPVMIIVFWLFRGVMAGEQVWRGADMVVNSVTASGLAAGVAVLAALPLVGLAVRHPSRLTMGMERCAYVGHALPGIVVALSLVYFGARHALFLYQTLAMLILAYVVRFLPQAVGCVRASLLQVSPRLEDAARTLGHQPLEVIRSVTLPLLKPGILTGVALVFIACMKELPATLLLGPTGFDTLATRIWGATEEAFFARAAAPALILVAVSAVSIRFILRQEEKGFYA